ncbi:MAG: mitochondrial peripheral inner membrane protein [Piccolia ochrophora]|nr:MAG: mitochondrial peripheral inner membrane protein [Piccolia ochrophora]
MGGWVRAAPAQVESSRRDKNETRGLKRVPRHSRRLSLFPSLSLPLFVPAALTSEQIIRWHHWSRHVHRGRRVPQPTTKPLRVGATAGQPSSPCYFHLNPTNPGPFTGLRSSRRYLSNPGRRNGHRRWPRLSLTIVLAAAASLAVYTALVRASQPDKPSTLNPHRFSAYAVVDRSSLTASLSLLTLRPVNGAAATDVPPLPRQAGIHSIEIAHPALTIARAYTPLPLVDESPAERFNLRLLIRRAAGGEVSGYLHALPVGSHLSLRGPRLEYNLSDDLGDAPLDVLFIAGGTGIAPALQTAETLLGQDTGSNDRRGRAQNRITILWATRTRAECLGAPLQHRLTWWQRFSRQASPAVQSIEPSTESNAIVRTLADYQAAHPDQAVVNYFPDDESQHIDRAVVSRALRDLSVPPSETDAVREPSAGKPDGRRKLILVSGPDGFVAAMAGRKTWAEGRTADDQGRLGGLLRGLGREVEGWKIWKL